MMISYHASQEQFTPGELLSYAVLAEQAGFDACHSSDHFHPWSKRQAQSGFTLSWLGAAMQATRFPFSFVNAPGQRYHPAIIAQAIATLVQLFPGRLDVAFGSGEALNEKINGEDWPEKSIRNERLLESVNIIRRLWAGETVTQQGHIKISEATLYTRPSTPPACFGAALSLETARWSGSWADGLLMTYRPVSEMKRMVDAFREGGGQGKPVHVQMAFSYDRSEQQALEGAYHQWRSNLVPQEALADLHLPEQFDEASASLTLNDLKKKILITSSLETCLDVLQQAQSVGIDNFILHNVNRNQELFIEDFGASVLPAIKEKKDVPVI